MWDRRNTNNNNQETFFNPTDQKIKTHIQYLTQNIAQSFYILRHRPIQDKTLILQHLVFIGTIKLVNCPKDQASVNQIHLKIQGTKNISLAYLSSTKYKA